MTTLGMLDEVVSLDVDSFTEEEAQEMSRLVVNRLKTFLPIDTGILSQSAVMKLKRNNLFTVHDVVEASKRHHLQIPGVGPTTKRELREMVQREYGMAINI